MSTLCCKISDVNPIYDPVKFGKWLSDAYDDSSFKSFAKLAAAVGTSRSSISRYIGAKDQTLTNKPSQPRPELVIKLAEVLKKDVNEALLLAGHAPKNGNGIGAGIARGIEKIPPEDRPRAIKQIKAIIKTYVDDPDFDFDYGSEE